MGATYLQVLQPSLVFEYRFLVPVVGLFDLALSETGIVVVVLLV